jgi:hypothetical protein
VCGELVRDHRRSAGLIGGAHFSLALRVDGEWLLAENMLAALSRDESRW